MDLLKIKKLQEGVFKHVVNDVEDQSFYSTTFVKLSIDNGIISINSGTFNRDFYLGRIDIYDVNSTTPIVYTDMDDFVKKLAGLGYPYLVQNSINSTNSATTADKELIVTTYSVKTAFTGASAGDMITATQVIDVTGTPTTVSTIWRNQTTGADLSSAPSADNLTLLGSQSLTDAQLRAAAIAVETPLPVDPFVGQLKIATSSTAVALPNKILKNGIVLKASSSNTSNLFVGASGVTTTDDGTGNGYKLEPGEAISFAILNSNTIYVNGTAGNILYYSGN